MTADGPAQLLERQALLESAGSHRSDVLVKVTVVQERAAASKATAATALTHAATLKKQAATALASASQVEAGARQQAATVEAQQTTLQAQLQKAQQTVLGLVGARAAAARYDAQQAAAARAAAEAAARAAAQAAAQSAADAASGSASGGSSNPSPVGPSGPPAGAGSSSAARTAINAAMRWIGTRYAWGGGSLTGPSEGWGIDAGVIGFDCSGLTRYAYAQAGIYIARNSSMQYATLPKVSSSNLWPGDLVFYATNTSNPSTIHHVAMYLGNGEMIEAPESGRTVHVTAMRWGEYIGAVRPSA
jgi:cell wall-associated NlpC family hydrolase